MSVKDYIKVDSSARSNAETGTQSSNTLDAVTDSAKNSAAGKRQDAPYGRRIPVLLFHVQEIGYGESNQNPIVLHPGLGAVGPRPHEKILEFRGIPSRGSGALCSPSSNYDNTHLAPLMSYFYIRSGVEIRSGNKKESAKVITPTVEAINGLLSVGPIIAFCTIEQGNNYGYIDEFELLEPNDQRKIRKSRTEGKSQKYVSQFRTVGSIPSSKGTLTVSRKVKLLSHTLGDIPSVPEEDLEVEPEVPELVATNGRVGMPPLPRIPDYQDTQFSDPAANEIARITMEEFDNWPMNGGLPIKHTDNKVRDIILKYVEGSGARPVFGFTGNGPPFNSNVYKWYEGGFENIGIKGIATSGWRWSAVFIRWCTVKAGVNPRYASKNTLATHFGYTDPAMEDTINFLKAGGAMPQWIFLNGPDKSAFDTKYPLIKTSPVKRGADKIPSYSEIGYKPSYGDIILGSGGRRSDSGYHGDILTPKGIIGGNLSRACNARPARYVFGIVTLNKHAKDLLETHKAANP